MPIKISGSSATSSSSELESFFEIAGTSWNSIIFDSFPLKKSSVTTWLTFEIGVLWSGSFLGDNILTYSGLMADFFVSVFHPFRLLGVTFYINWHLFGLFMKFKSWFFGVYFDRKVEGVRSESTIKVVALGGESCWRREVSKDCVFCVLKTLPEVPKLCFYWTDLTDIFGTTTLFIGLES